MRAVVQHDVGYIIIYPRELLAEFSRGPTLGNLFAPSNIIVVRKIYSLSALCHNYGGSHLSRSDKKLAQMLIYAGPCRPRRDPGKIAK